MNELAAFEDMDGVELFGNFRMNQIVLLVKTFKSWNAWPRSGTTSATRKNLNVNVEPAG
jgi:hypothetical protein